MCPPGNSLQKHISVAQGWLVFPEAERACSKLDADSDSNMINKQERAGPDSDADQQIGQSPIQTHICRHMGQVLMVSLHWEEKRGERFTRAPSPPHPRHYGRQLSRQILRFSVKYTFFKFQKQESRGGKYLKYRMLRQYHHTRNYIQHIQRHRSLLICFFFHFL